jgi:glycosyltransferase 2 family protein
MREGKRSARIVLRVAVLATVIALLGVFLGRVPWHELRTAFHEAAFGWVLAAAFLTLVGTLLRGMVLRALLSPVVRLRVTRATRYTLAASTGSILAPLRAGDALRAFLLVRHEDVALATCGAVYACEKIGDMTVLLLLSAPLPWLLGPLPAWVRWSILGLSGVVVAGAAVVAFTRRSSWAKAAARRIGPIGSPKSLLAAAAPLLAFWLVDGLAVLAVLRAVGVTASPAGAALVLLAVNIAIAIPTPANAGTLELGAVVALHALGVEPGRAFAFAVLYHAAQVLPVLAAGMMDGSMLWGAGVRRPAIASHIS